MTVSVAYTSRAVFDTDGLLLGTLSKPATSAFGFLDCDLTRPAIATCHNMSDFLSDVRAGMKIQHDGTQVQNLPPFVLIIPKGCAGRLDIEGDVRLQALEWIAFFDQPIRIPSMIRLSSYTRMAQMLSDSRAPTRADVAAMTPAFLMDRRIVIGGKREATDVAFLHDLCITHVLNCADGEVDPVVELEIPGFSIPARDELSYPILERHLSDVCTFLDRAMAEDPAARILIHCSAGMNRSVVLAVAYVHGHGTPLFDAVDAILRTRPFALSNVEFVRQLVQHCEPEGHL